MDPARAEGETEEHHRARLETGLMALFRDRGEDDAFEALHAIARPTLLRSISFGLRGTAAGVDPTEVLQDTFVNIYRYAAGFRDRHPSSFRAWARTIAHNVARQHLGRRRHGSLDSLPESLQEPADSRANPALLVCGEEERAGLRRAWVLLLIQYAAAFSELSPRDRLALTLVEVEGLSYTETCERLGVGMSNMKMIMFRARKRIRGRMEEAMARGAEAVPAHRRAG
ncbi:MAG: sigma-70 family RNA polymerase sigma factor [Planctomycetota bacterium]|nr:sigma-70 family RNA polymerase sigma factor [Planctomycetota bacterium]MDP6989689.1 sigma-70 family RNA polymerase sigma factor [Planctomycetota bacterium]